MCVFFLCSSSLLFLVLFLGEFSGGQCGCVGHVYAKEDEQGLAPAVSCRHVCQCEVLFLVSEASFHHRSPEVADDAPRCADGLVLVFWLGAFAYKVGGDVVCGAVGAVLVGGVDGVRAHTLDFDASQTLLIFNAFFEADSFVECLKRDVLDERDAVYLDVVALGSELHTLVLFAADNGADVWPVDAHDAVFHFLVVKQVLLLAQHLFTGQKTFVLLGGQNDSHGVLFDQHAPLAEQLLEQVEQTTQQLAGGRFLVLSLLGVGQAGLVHIFIFAARLPLAKVFAGLLEQFMNPLAALPQQFHVRGKAQVALIACGVGHAQVLVAQLGLPFAVQHPLQLLDVKQSRQTVADGAHDFAVLDRTEGIDEHPAEHLHVDAAVERLYQPVVRQAQIGLEEHQRHLPLGREHGFVALRMRAAAV